MEKYLQCIEASTAIVSKRGDDAAEAFHALMECDAEVAKKFIVTTVPTFFPSAIGIPQQLMLL